MTHPTAFKTPADETAYFAAYDATLKFWPVPYEELEISSRYGMTHVVTSGTRDAPPLLLLHGFMSTLTMWSPNITDFSRDYRVYAIDIMGHPSKSIPAEPIRDAADYMAWLGATLDGLNLDHISLVGMSFGGWLALSFAMTAPERVRKLVLLSPAACFLPIVRQFIPRLMLSMLYPRRFWFNSLMHWMGIGKDHGNAAEQRVIDLMYAGTQYFRLEQETTRVMPTVFSDNVLRALQVPVLLLIGENEVIYDAAKALTRAQQLIPDFAGELVPGCSHDMSMSQSQIVDERVLTFLKDS